MQRNDTHLLLCDSHAHLSDEAFADERFDLARRTLEGSLSFIIDVGTHPETWKAARALSEAEERVWATIGWHPHDARRAPVGTIGEQLDAAWWDKVCAVGEIGLDYHYDFSPREVQRQVFAEQLAYAAGRKRPVVIHVREAWPDALELLAEADLTHGGVVHCFTGTYVQAARSLDLGLHVSFTGVITFPRSTELRSVLARLPLDRVFFETDCPYLSPVPFRGKRNEPNHVVHVVEAAARVWNRPVEAVARTTTTAAARLFGIPVPTAGLTVGVGEHSKEGGAVS